MDTITKLPMDANLLYEELMSATSGTPLIKWPFTQIYCSNNSWQTDVPPSNWNDLETQIPPFASMH